MNKQQNDKKNHSKFYIFQKKKLLLVKNLNLTAKILKEKKNVFVKPDLSRN